MPWPIRSPHQHQQLVLHTHTSVLSQETSHLQLFVCAAALQRSHVATVQMLNFAQQLHIEEKTPFVQQSQIRMTYLFFEPAVEISIFARDCCKGEKLIIVGTFLRVRAESCRLHFFSLLLLSGASGPACRFLGLRGETQEGKKQQCKLRRKEFVPKNCQSGHARTRKDWRERVKQANG